eukprot:2143625-Prorocentrum_lima.AAC.1
MALDAKNASGPMSRQALALAIQQEFPELQGLIRHLLVPARQAYWMDGNGQLHSLQMSTGVHQGCPFSMGLFSVIIG